VIIVRRGMCQGCCAEVSERAPAARLISLSLFLSLSLHNRGDGICLLPAITYYFHYINFLIDIARKNVCVGGAFLCAALAIRAV